MEHEVVQAAQVEQADRAEAVQEISRDQSKAVNV